MWCTFIDRQPYIRSSYTMDKRLAKQTAQEKQQFSDRLDTVKGKPPKGPPWGNDKPSM